MAIDRGRLVVRILVPAAYLALAAAVFAARGVPLDRGMLAAWILGGLLCLSLGSLSGFVRSLLLEWLPLLAALTLYDVLRGVGGGRFPIHGELQVWIDRYVFGFGSVPTVWLQQHLYHAGHTTPVDAVAFFTYMSYFFLTPVALGTIWLVDRALFRRYARQLTLLAFAAVAFFTVSPTIPPWLAAQKHMFAGSAQRLVGIVGAHMGYWDATPLWERGLRLANDLAAFPSLHEAMTILLSVVLWRRVARAVRPLLVVYPLLMAFSLVYLGEHYVVDLAGGAALVGAVVYAEPRLLRALRARRGRGVRASTVVEPA
jgi:membrane-associated phospholipid phosphatase